MAYKRLLTIQDISCVGQCSMTVALPILSACGHETCILPTALLSTHTGGFGKPAVIHFDDHLPDIIRHWKQNDILFDAILVGYLGSEAAVNAVEYILDSFLEPDGVSIVDPAFADHGKIYSGLSESYARAMERLCRKANVILPNVTEAAFFAGLPYQEDLDEGYIRQLLEKLNHSCVVMTGVAYQENETGIILQEKNRFFHYTHAKIGKNCHGTGDMFASCFTGAWMQGKTKEASIKIAADFVCESIRYTVAAPVHWYGVKFEKALPGLIRALE